ncbi:MAG: DUF1707 SHOCT-like domain-containing protein [Gaiellaceae bacterium]
MSDIEKRASDAEREQAVARLREASTEGRLTLEELADRTALAYRAQSHGELDRVVADLPAAPARPSRKRPVAWTVVVIGDSKRRGRWRVAERTRVVLGIGNCELDLREAELEGDEIEVTIAQLIGDTTLIVPKHVEVDLSGILLIGSKHERGETEELAPGAPLVRVRVFGLIGEVKVVRR